MAPTQPAVAPDLDLLLRKNRRHMAELHSEGLQSVQNAFRHLTMEDASEAAPFDVSATLVREQSVQPRLTISPNTQVGQSSTLYTPSHSSPINTSRLPVAEEQTQDGQNHLQPLASTSTSVGTSLPAQHRSTPKYHALSHGHSRPGSSERSNLERPSSYDAALRGRLNQYQGYLHHVQDELHNAGPNTYVSPPIPPGEFHAGEDSVQRLRRHTRVLHDTVSDFDPNEPDPEHSRPFAWECWALRLLLQDRHGYTEGDLRAYLRAEYNEALRRKDARLAYMRRQ
ncbi:uncharacterized protein AB675_701 [Cyphellophora attinorum]|uniref:Uncharacterized protein n=1 Tax=Cyphellophora attinorum TaxID=1664694 RepID=A0A0N1HI41_9EURO|nr:uncharacterized protein AB675_701 [Phialophora attinorum]KPI45866.1 hypothetical protein AB675_701 [Phialophora attinorum]